MASYEEQRPADCNCSRVMALWEKKRRIQILIEIHIFGLDKRNTSNIKVSTSSRMSASLSILASSDASMRRSKNASRLFSIDTKVFLGNGFLLD